MGKQAGMPEQQVQLKPAPSGNQMVTCQPEPFMDEYACNPPSPSSSTTEKG
jgi:hypothetical protein